MSLSAQSSVLPVPTEGGTGLAQHRADRAAGPISSRHLCEAAGQLTLELEKRRDLWHSPTDSACLCCSNMCRWQLLQVLIQPKRGMLKGCVCSVPRNDGRQALTEGRGVHGSKHCLGPPAPLRDRSECPVLIQKFSRAHGEAWLNMITSSSEVVDYICLFSFLQVFIIKISLGYCHQLKFSRCGFQQACAYWVSL